MAFSFDSLAASVLMAAAIFGWAASRPLRSGIRVNLRFAAIMLAAFAASLLTPGLGSAVGWLSGSLAATALFLAFAFPQSAPIWLSSFLFSAAFVFGLAGALDLPAVGFLGQAGAQSALLATAIARFRDHPDRASALAGLSAIALLFASLALMDGSRSAALFFAAGLGLIVRSLKKPVVELEPQRDLLIGGHRG